MGRLRRSGRFRKQPKQLHRVPVLPFRDAPKGHCRMCGTKVQGRRRTWCSDHCILHWHIASDNRVRRHQVFLRDRGKCQKCGVDCVKEGIVWQVDHIKPLIECSRNNIQMFLMGNLRTLCVNCHSGETIRLNRKRKKEKLAAIREIKKASGGRVAPPKIKRTKVVRKKERRTTKELLRRMSVNPSSSRLSVKIDVKKLRRRF